MISISELYKIYLSSSGVTIDTRKLSEGQVFFALKGDNFDGNTYAKSALEKGAFKVVVDDPTVVCNGDCILVEDGLEALQKLASFHRQQLSIPVLGITGSNGKTTTKELLQAVLASCFKVSATVGNYNNHIGVPLTLLNADRSADFLIVEMGTNQKGDIDLLCRISAPTAGLITNIGFAHLEKLIDQNGVYKEKSQLFHHVDKGGGVIFRNQADMHLKEYRDDLSEIINYNDHGYASVQVKLKEGISNYLECSIHTDRKRYELHTNLVGDYNLINIVAALCIGTYNDVPIEKAIKAITDYMPDNMRSQLITTDRNAIVLDAYNANPSSMKESITAFIKIEEENQILIIGDMLELGEQSADFHQQILNLSVLSKAEKVILVGNIFSSLDSDFESYKDIADLISSGVLGRLIGKKILVKGSRGIQLEKVLFQL